MRIRHEKYNIIIEIVSDDWDRNLAQKMIAHIKALGKGNYYYNPVSKNWTVKNTPEYKEYFRKFKAEWKEAHKDEPVQLRLDLDEFDTQKWLDEIFPQ